MCDLNENKLATEQEMKRKEKKISDGKCMKCKEGRAVVIVRVHDPMCRSCFLAYSTHKFRSTLGKSKLIRANDKVLLAVSGGQSSISMLHHVKEALSFGAHKRLKFSPGIIFVDESITVGRENHEEINSIKAMAEDLGYPFYRVPIYQNIEDENDNGSWNIEKEKIEFQKKFQSIDTLTAKTDFITNLRTKIIVYTARKHSYCKVMLGENATALSIKLLCNISQGRGMTIPKDIAIGDDRYQDVTIVRPMRELSSKEVAMYNSLSGLNVQPIPNLHTMQDGSSSLQRQTEEFIIGLQAEFPSTVNTVFRTGDKLCANEHLENTGDCCCLCGGLLVKHEDEEASCGKESCCGTSDECSNKKFKLTVSDVKSHLCYGCNLTFRDMKYNLNCLPAYILDEISSTMKRKKMKESIQDFLLE